jgi:hypothetical protein
MFKLNKLKLAAICAFSFGAAMTMNVSDAADPGCWTRCWEETFACLQTLPANQHNLCYEHYNFCSRYTCGGMEP